ncbi:hypothetical protein [Streptosporangium amethystogenes]|uniref:hypothetical protein n=1 Tax=Streptosporangium amethystogenes TaxID=2002 RepID=UPI001FDF9698|nr:hypothetical protein [Streptosporangium amethystogenes]
MRFHALPAKGVRRFRRSGEPDDLMFLLDELVSDRTADISAGTDNENFHTDLLRQKGQSGESQDRAGYRRIPGTPSG